MLSDRLQEMLLMELHDCGMCCFVHCLASLFEVCSVLPISFVINHYFANGMRKWDTITANTVRTMINEKIKNVFILTSVISLLLKELHSSLRLLSGDD